MPYLNRWTQPDTIVPNPGNPQNFNHFSYVLNNPLKYSDPDGHDECDANCRERREAIQSYVILLIDNKEHLGIDDLEILALTVDYASTFYNDSDVDALPEFVQDVSSVLVGYTATNADFWADKVLDAIGVRNENQDLSHARHEEFEDRGYLPIYRDKSNQAHHFWFYVEVSAVLPAGKTIANAANLAHETIAFRDADNLLGIGNPLDVSKREISLLPPYVSLGNGRSLTDVLLGAKGAQLGHMLKTGGVKYSEAGNWIRNNIGNKNIFSRLRNIVR